MGQIKIRANLGEGRYTVEVLRDVERGKTRKKQFEEQVKDLEKKGVDLKKSLDEAKAKELEERQAAELKAAEFSNDAETIAILSDTYDSVNFVLEADKATLKSQENTKAGLEAAINSGSYTGVDLANLQSQLTAINADITDQKKKIADGEKELKRIQDEIKTLDDPKERIKAIEEIFSKISAVVFETQKWQTAVNANNLQIDAKKKRIAEFDEAIKTIDIRDAWCVDYAIDLDEGMEDLETQIEEVTNSIARLNAGQVSNKSRVNELLKQGFTNDSQEVKNAKSDISNSKDELEKQSKQKNDLLTKSRRVSVDINDESNHILIAPYTYEVKQQDIDDKEIYIQKKLDERNGFLDKADKVQVKIDALQDKISQAYADITEKSLLMAYIGQVEIGEDYLITRRKNLQDEIDALRESIKQHSRDINKLQNEQNKYRTKADTLTTRILLLNDELKDLNTAAGSSDKIYKPKVTDRTRQFQPTISSSPEAVYFNKALLPGVQKWMPTYRLGTILSIGNNDFCTVELEDAESSQQQLDINQHKVLENVLIKYGSCNSSVFEVGDRVVVEFQNREQDSPIVIGFEDNPRSCGLAVYVKRTNPPSVKLYQKAGSNPGDSISKEAQHPYWYDRAKKKCVSWWSFPQDIYADSRVGKAVYIKGKLYDLPPVFLFRHHLIACCLANDEQVEQIKLAYPDVGDDIVICVSGIKESFNNGNIYAPEYICYLEKVYVLSVNDKLKSLLEISPNFSFDISPNAGLSSGFYSEWDVIDTRFDRDSLNFIISYNVTVEDINYRAEKYSMIISGSGLLVTRSGLVNLPGATTNSSYTMLGGAIDDDYYYYVYGSGLRTNESYDVSPVNRFYIGSHTDTYTVKIGRVHIQNGAITEDYKTIYSEALLSTADSQFIVSAGPFKYINKAEASTLIFIFISYEPKSDTSLYAVIKQDGKLDGSGEGGNGYSESVVINQSVKFYVNIGGVEQFSDYIMPNYTSSTSTHYEQEGSAGSPVSFTPDGVFGESTSISRNLVLSGSRFRTSGLSFYIGYSALGGWRRDYLAGWSTRQWIFFGYDFAIKFSSGENGKIFVYDFQILFKYYDQTVFEPGIVYRHSTSYDITAAPVEYVIPEIIGVVSVTK
jgi:hypothetical protein